MVIIIIVMLLMMVLIMMLLLCDVIRMIKFYDIQCFDMSNMIAVTYVPTCATWLSQGGSGGAKGSGQVGGRGCSVVGWWCGRVLCCVVWCGVRV